MEPDRGEFGERRVGTPDPVQVAEQRREAVITIEVPVPHLVLLGVEVVLDAGTRCCDHQLVHGSVDTPTGRERGREDRAEHECRTTAGLQLFGQDVVGVRPGVGSEVVDRAGRQLLEVVTQLRCAVAPREVGVRLVETGLGEALHDPRPGERLGQEDRLGMFGAQRGHGPLPERERLGVRVVDTEDRHAPVDPEPEHVGESGPQVAPVVGLEVERVDVLVPFRRVLGVLDRAVRTGDEPVGMLGDPRVVGRAVERDVDREVHAARSAGGCQGTHVVDGAELGCDREVPTRG